MSEESLVFRLRKRAEIRKQIPSRKSVQENKPDRIADLLEEAANFIEKQQKELGENFNYIQNLQRTINEKLIIIDDLCDKFEELENENNRNSGESKA